ncbi:MAG: hypothetical protein HY343_10650 [Lentisphaerae bacterium]|nr:hypothetical protein [Lentisphaerota bacterium]
MKRASDLAFSFRFHPPAALCEALRAALRAGVSALIPCLFLAFVSVGLPARADDASPAPGFSANEKLGIENTAGGNVLPSRLQPQTPLLARQNVASDPFNEYVPGFSSRAGLTLQPFVRLPYLHLPYVYRAQRPFPEDRANFKLGDFLFVDLTLNGDLTFTDNVKSSSDNRETDLVLQTVLGADVVLQLTETLQLEAAGNLAYYQSLSDSDLSGYGFRDEYRFDDAVDLDAGLDLRGHTLYITQAGWSEQFDDWDVFVQDRFSISDRVMDDPFVNDSFERTLEIANIVRGGVGRLLPIESRLGLNGSHANYWYNEAFDAYERSEDSGELSLSVDRNSMRFQPYAEVSLRAVDYKTGDRDATIEEARLGARGPVTDQMNMEGNIGYLRAINETESSGGLLWRLSIDHLMNTSTRQQILFQRNAAPSPTAAQGTAAEFLYTLGHTLGPDMLLWLGYSRTLFADPNEDQRRWSLLARLERDIARNTRAGLDYQYVNWDSETSAQSFSENRFTLSIKWDM